LHKLNGTNYKLLSTKQFNQALISANHAQHDEFFKELSQKLVVPIFKNDVFVLKDMASQL